MPRFSTVTSKFSPLTKTMAKPNHSQPATPGLPPPRTPARPPTSRPRARVSVLRSQALPSSSPSPVQSGPKLPPPEGRYEAQRRWFDHEVGTLRRLAQTERLAGDFVTAQRLERELDSFIREATALLEQERPR